MTDKYNLTSERLAEKLLYNKDFFDFELVDLKNPFPVDQLNQQDKLHKIIDEVQGEFNYEMSEFQCSWAVVFVKNDCQEQYKEKTGIDVQPRK